MNWSLENPYAIPYLWKSLQANAVILRMMVLLSSYHSSPLRRHPRKSKIAKAAIVDNIMADKHDGWWERIRISHLTKQSISDDWASPNAFKGNTGVAKKECFREYSSCISQPFGKEESFDEYII